MGKRITTITLSIICMLLTCLTPVKADSKKKITKPVVTYMKAAKSYNPDKMKTCFIRKPTYAYAKFYSNLFKSNNEKYLSYKILEIKPKKKIATVKVKVTQPDYYVAFTHAYYNYLNWYMNYYYYHDKQPSDNVAGNRVNQYMKKCIKKYKKGIKQRTVIFNLQKTSAGWKIKSATKKIKDISSMRMYQAMDDAQYCWEEDEDINEIVEVFE